MLVLALAVIAGLEAPPPPSDGTPAPAPSPSATPAAAARVVSLSDPGAGAALTGAVVRLERKNGSFYQGTVTFADATRLVIDCAQDVPAAEIASLRTLRPARLPVGAGALARIVLAKTGETFQGVVSDVGDDSIAIQDETKEARVKWSAIERVEVEAEREGGLAFVQALSARLVAPVERAPAPVPAPAPEAPEPAGAHFGRRGVLELGGNVAFAAGSAELETSISKSRASGHDLALSPFAGYFLLPGLQAFAGVTLSSDVTDLESGGDEWNNGAGAEIGLAYFFERASGLRVGPHLAATGYSAGGESEDPGSGITFEYEERGWGGRAGLGLRVPLGESALLDVSAYLYQERYQIDVYPGGIGSHGDGRRSGFMTTLGLSVWVEP